MKGKQRENEDANTGKMNSVNRLGLRTDKLRQVENIRKNSKNKTLENLWTDIK